ncbi:shikimate dehydrogenase [Ignicoccus pacificus DSM 13166]|uniref:Shikimate dehydrogenase (NADP(+)) n=1 Tax=Ignicoccus pacificus DSM 13166 TaxID=940294 RepID=A0A977KA06_9CREN|nr:shikimate dehydrogenase [Ignicoccus pacificus DSM 13166]
MKLFAVIGHPIKHSLSPQLHRIAFRLIGEDATYTKVDVHPESLETFMEVAPLVFKGLNVTIPHKERVYELVDEVMGVASEVKAVNTVLFEDSRSYGFNTDVKGVRMAIESEVNARGMKVAILGAGGAARAAVVAFYKDCKVTVFNRTLEKAQRLAREFGVEARPLKDYEEIRRHNIIINATPVGMDGRSTPIPIEVIERNHVVMDMVYRPLFTPLLKGALRRGAKTVDGLRMLVIQGLESEKIWLGKAPDWKVVYMKLLAELANG